jgi:ankyrin repeat protein
MSDLDEVNLEDAPPKKAAPVKKPKSKKGNIFDDDSTDDEGDNKAEEEKQAELAKKKKAAELAQKKKAAAELAAKKKKKEEADKAKAEAEAEEEKGAAAAAAKSKKPEGKKKPALFDDDDDEDEEEEEPKPEKKPPPQAASASRMAKPASIKFHEVLVKEASKEKALLACRTIYSIMSNVVKSPKDGKYRKINSANERFNANVYQYPACQNFLKAFGWVIDDEQILSLPMSTPTAKVEKSLLVLRGSIDELMGMGTTVKKVGIDWNKAKITIPQAKDEQTPQGQKTFFHLHIDGRFFNNLRYSDLGDLNDRLVKKYPECTAEGMARFPKKTNSWFGKINDQQLQERRDGLEKWLQSCAKIAKIAKDPIFGRYLAPKDFGKDVKVEEVQLSSKDTGNKPKALREAAGSNDVAKIAAILAQKGGVFSKSGAMIIDTPDAKGWTATFYACEKGHDKALDALIQSAADLEIKSKEQQSCLHIAALNVKAKCARLILGEKPNLVQLKDQNGKTPFALLLSVAKTNPSEFEPLVSLLVGYRADIRTTDANASTALHWAVNLAYPKLVDILLKKGCPANAKRKTGDTALHYAAKKGPKAQILLQRLLMHPGIDMDCKNNNKEAPINLAVEVKDANAVKLLAEAGADVDARPSKEEVTALHWATLQSLEELMDLLIEKGCNVNAQSQHGMTALHVAAEKGYKVGVEKLIEADADVNARMKKPKVAPATPLHFAIASKGEDGKSILELLTENGADVDLRDNAGVAPIHAAVEGGQQDLIEFLVELADLSATNSHDQTVMMVATLKGNHELVNTLVSKDASTDSQDDKGLTAIHHALNSENYEIVASLVDAGADPNLKNNAGFTPLLQIVVEGPKIDEREETLEKLIGADAEADTEDNQGISLLIHAIKQGLYDPMLKHLIPATNDVNTADKSERSVLYLACINNKIEVVEALLEKDADVDTPDKEGRTALIGTLRASFDADDKSKIVDALLEKDADVDVVDASGFSALQICLDSEDIRTIGTEKIVPRAGDSLNSDHPETGLAPIHKAVAEGEVDFVSSLIGAGADVDKQDSKNGYTSFHHAILSKANEDCREELVKELIGANASVDIADNKDLYPLIYAASKDQFELAEEFIIPAASDSIDSANAKGGTALHIGSYKGKASFVAAMLKAGADANVQDSNGDTPLLLALRGYGSSYDEGVEELCQALSSGDANVDLGNNKGLVPIHVALAKELTQVILETIIPNGDDSLSSAGAEGKTPLIISVKGGNSDLVTALLDKDVDVDTKDESGNTALHYALMDKNAEVASAIIEKGPDLDEKSADNVAPIFLAIDGEMSEVFNQLVSAGADTAVRNQDNDTALTYAVAKNDLDTVTFLKENDADLEEVGASKVTPLFQALRAEFFDVFKFLAESGASVNVFDAKKMTPLLHAIKESHYELVVEIILPNIESDNLNAQGPKGQSALIMAVVAEASEVVTALLEVDELDLDVIDKAGNSALHYALQQQNAELATAIIEKGADLNAENSEDIAPLFIALEGDMNDVFQLLVTNGADTDAKNSEGETALTYAVEKENLETVTFLKENGANLEAVGAKKITPLFLALKNGFAEIVTYLAEEGASVNAYDEDQLTPLLYAVNDEQYFELAVETIIPRCTPTIVNFQNSKGQTALVIATLAAAEAVVETLIGFDGIDLDIVDKGGYTALHHGLNAGHEDISSALINGGADLEITNRAGDTALFSALKRNYDTIIDQILEKGGTVDVKDKKGTTILHYCLANDKIDLATSKIIPAASSDSLNETNDEGKTGAAIAVVSDNLELLEAMLAKDVDLTIADADGSAPLHFAIAQNNAEILEKLISSGADVNQDGPKDESTVFMALKSDAAEELLNVLLEGGASLAVHGAGGATPLTYCLDNDLVDLALALIPKAGEAVNFAAKSKKTPLRVAASMGQHDMLSALIEASADVDEESLGAAIKASAVDCVEALVQASAPVSSATIIAAFEAELDSDTIDSVLIPAAGAAASDADEKGNIPLFFAAEKGLISTIEALIGAGGDINSTNSSGDTALTFVLGSGQTEVVEKLVELGGSALVDAPGKDGTPLQIALAGKGLKDIAVDVLLPAAESSVNVLQNGCSLLWQACKNEDVALAEALLQKGADANEASAKGVTPLAVAIAAGEGELTALLLSNGASADSACLEAAFKAKSAPVLESLLDAGGDANTKIGGVSMLSLAVKSGLSEVVQVLIGHGCDVNVAGDDGATALLHAFTLGKTKSGLESFEALLEAKADPNVLYKSSLFGKDAETKKVQKGKFVVVAEDGTVVRKAQDDKSVIKKFYTVKSVVTVADLKGDFAKVDNGWCMVEDLKNTEEVMEFADETTILHAAVLLKKDAYIDTLLEAGAAVNLADANGVSAKEAAEASDKVTPTWMKWDAENKEKMVNSEPLSTGDYTTTIGEEEVTVTVSYDKGKIVAKQDKKAYFKADLKSPVGAPSYPYSFKATFTGVKGEFLTVLSRTEAVAHLYEANDEGEKIKYMHVKLTLSSDDDGSTEFAALDEELKNLFEEEVQYGDIATKLREN